MTHDAEISVMACCPFARSKWVDGQCRIVNGFGRVLGVAPHDRGRPFATVEADAWSDALKKIQVGNNFEMEPLA